MKTKNIFLSYTLNEDTPTYGSRNKFNQIKKSDISKGDVANDTSIETTVHIGTHIDMPFHFFENGQTIVDFGLETFISENVLYLEIKPKSLVIKDELIDKLENIENKKNYEFLIVKTGICEKRNLNEFWESNYGFDPIIADYLRNNFSKIRIFGFDSISVSSFQHRLIGREAHKTFLNPKSPILLLEDMDLTKVNKDTIFKKIIIAPLRIEQCDGLPCTVIGEII